MNKQNIKLLSRLESYSENTLPPEIKAQKNMNTNIPPSNPGKEYGFGLQVLKLYTQPTHSITIPRQPAPRVVTRPAFVPRAPREEKRPEKVQLPVVTKTPSTAQVKTTKIMKEPEVKTEKKKATKKPKKKNLFNDSKIEIKIDEIQPAEPQVVEQEVVEPKVTIMQSRLRNRSLFDNKYYSSAPMPVDRPNKENVETKEGQNIIGTANSIALKSQRERENNNIGSVAEKPVRPLISRGQRRTYVPDRDDKNAPMAHTADIKLRRQSDLNEFIMDSDENRCLEYLVGAKIPKKYQ